MSAQAIDNAEHQLSPGTPQPKARELGREVAIQTQGNGNAVVPRPSTFAQMVEMSQLMAVGGPMVGKAFREKPGACLAILQQALRLDFDAYMMSQKAYLVGDTIGYEAQLVHAIILKNAPLTRRPRATYSGDGATRQIKVLFHVIGEDEPFEYESPKIADIKPQNSPLWKTDPDQQLWYYSVRAGARRHFPDVIMGVYTPEELSEAVRNAAPVDGGEITLTGAVAAASEGEAARDADFTPIDSLLTRGKKSDGPKADAKAEGVGGVSEHSDAEQPKPAEPAASSTETAADTMDGGSTTQALDGPSGDAPKSQQTDTSAKPATSKPETDAQLVTRIEAEVKNAKPTERSKPIRENREELERIAREANAGLMQRADKLLGMFELGDGPTS